MKKLLSIIAASVILCALSVNSFAASNGSHSHALKSTFLWVAKYETCTVSASGACGGSYIIAEELWTSKNGIRLDRDAAVSGTIYSTGKFSKSLSTDSASNANAGYYACYIKDEYGRNVSGTYGYGWN